MYVLGEQVHGSYSLDTTHSDGAGAGEPGDQPTGDIPRRLTDALAAGEDARVPAAADTPAAAAGEAGGAGEPG